METWGTRVDARREKYADEVENRRAVARSTADIAALDDADLALTRATHVLRPRVSWWPWWHSGDRRDAWAAIHDAELDLQTVRDLPSQVSEAVEHAHRDLPAHVAAERVSKLERERDPSKQAAAALELVKESHVASSRRLEALIGRTQLHWTLTIAATLAAVVAIGAQANVADPFLPPPRLASGARIATSPAVLLALVAGCGAIGGLLQAITDFLGRRAMDDVRWFDPKPAQAALKVAAGAWFGLIGVLAVATGFLVAEYTSMGAMLLLGIVFGYGQKAVTGHLDRAVGRILDVETGTATPATGRSG
jgi:hypothetical protein